MKKQRFLGQGRVRTLGDAPDDAYDPSTGQAGDPAYDQYVQSEIDQANADYPEQMARADIHNTNVEIVSVGIVTLGAVAGSALASKHRVIGALNGALVGAFAAFWYIVADAGGVK